MPHIDQLEGVWKLGAKYSHYPYVNNTDKIVASGLCVDHDTSPYGPVVTGGMGWAICQTVAKLDFGGDHGLFVAKLHMFTSTPPTSTQTAHPAVTHARSCK